MQAANSVPRSIFQSPQISHPRQLPLIKIRARAYLGYYAVFSPFIALCLHSSQHYEVGDCHYIIILSMKKNRQSLKAQAQSVCKSAAGMETQTV